MPLILKKHQENYTLYIWELTENEADFKKLIPSSIYTTIMGNTRLEKRRLEKFSQYCLQKEAGINTEDLYYLSNGKPALHSKNNISFSHSGPYSALLTGSEICGLDLEFPNDKILRIASKFISEREKVLLNKNENIYWAWSIKEAVFKYFGENVRFKDHIFLKKIDVNSNCAWVDYQGFHGKGQFEIELFRFKNSYLAFTKSYTSE